MSWLDELHELHQRHGCGNALDRALEIIAEQQELIEQLTSTQTNPDGGTVTLTKDTTMATVGTTSQATANFTLGGNPDPEPAGTTIAYSSDNETVDTVDANGLVTRVGAGTANIGAVATFPDGTTLTLTPAVDTVEVPNPDGGQVVLS